MVIIFDYLKIWEVIFDWDNIVNLIIFVFLEILIDFFDVGELFGNGNGVIC